MRLALVSTHRADRAHYAPLRRVLQADKRFELLPAEADDLDAAVVLGDRYEMLQAAIGLVERRIPLIHIHGGEHTIGSLDERWRWAITMVADIHCVVNEEAQWEVDKHILGDAKPGFTDAYRKLSLRTFVTGAPGLDGIACRKKIGGSGPPRILVLYNPAIDRATTMAEWAALSAALGSFEGELVMWLGPNGDRYSDSIDASGELDSEFYRDVLAGAQVIVGNSSSGIIEAPSLGTWAVNIGQRQRGRQRGPNVIDVPASAQAIAAAIQEALRRPRAPRINPYDPYADGRNSERVRDAILTLA